MSKRTVYMCFIKHLTKTVFNGQLVPGRHSASDWLKLLDRDELEKLLQMLKAVETTPNVVVPALTDVVMHLLALETGEQQVIVPLDQVIEGMTALQLLCEIEICIRRGYVEIYGQWRISEPDDPNHYASLTEKGYAAASQPGASAFLGYLKRQAEAAYGN